MNALGSRIALQDEAWRLRWRGALLVLGLGLAAFGLLFAEEAAAAIRVWNNNAAYNHCWLVLLIAGWLAWQRRGRLAGLAPKPLPTVALLVVPAVAAWFVAERLGLMEGRQLTAMTMLWALVLAVLGWRICRVMAAPLGYLIFLVPFGAFVTPLLQNATAWMIEIGLIALGYTFHRDGLIIETLPGSFHVAEACAGLRFLIAALAFGALYAFTMFRSPGRRLLVMVLAVAVPVVANGIRALGIVVAAEFVGSAEAAAADHVIYGWGFFSAVMLLLILAGLPFRQDHMPERVPATPPLRAVVPRPVALATAAGLALGVMAAGPAVAAVLDRMAGAPRDVALLSLVAPSGCEAAGQAELRCGDATVTVRLVAFPPQVTWTQVAAERRHAHAGAGSDEDTEFIVAVPGRVIWRGRNYDRDLGGGATAAWLAGRPVGDGIGPRLAQARNSLRLGDGGVPVLATVRLRVESAEGTRRWAEALLRAVLEAQTEGLTIRAAALSMGRQGP